MTYAEQLEKEQKHKLRLEEIVNSEEATQLVEFYKDHSQTETIEKFRIDGVKQLRKILTALNFDFDYKKHHTITKGRPAKRPHESYIEGGKKSSATQKANWENKSEEEKQAWSEKMSSSHLTNHYNRLKITHLPSTELYSDDILITTFKERLDKNGIESTSEFPISNRSYDFKVDNTLIEINPYATHNSTWGIKGGKPKSKYYHEEKTKLATDNGYRCIHIWDWDDPQKVINLLKRKETIYARQCEVKSVSKGETINFINEYHLQGYAKDQIRLGLYYNNELVSIMTFDKPRYNKNYEYELVRYCANKNIIGGAEKLFKHFIDEFNPASIVSYCDLSKFTGETYDKLGFTLLRNNRAARHWFSPKTSDHYTDNMVRRLGADKLLNTNYGKGTSNDDILRLHGFVEIYDCGQATYVWLPQK